jgi:uncharacterized protein YndB with AHSA1/START domain
MSAKTTGAGGHRRPARAGQGRALSPRRPRDESQWKERTMARTEITAEPGVPQLLVTRIFDAPRELLFRAHIDPDLLVQWLGPRHMAMTIDRFDPRHGGMWRYIHWDPVGGEYAFRGVFHGTPSLDGIVQTFEYEGTPGHVSMETVTFSEEGDKTLLCQVAVYQSVEDRDHELAAGMAEGVYDSMERLDEVLARMTPVH